MELNYIHPSFRLNGKRYSIEELIKLSNTWVSGTEEYLIDLGNLIIQWFNTDDYVSFTTSGTTGPPKVIQIKKEAMVYSAKATGSFFNIEVGDTALLCMSAKFVGGKLMFIRALILGWKLDVKKPTARPLLGSTEEYDFVAMVPMQVENSLKELVHIKKLIIGGAKVNKTLIEKLQLVDTQVYETYGMTETITHIAAKLVGTNAFSVLPHIVITSDTRGCLVISAPTINPDVIITNDLVEIINDRQFVWLGRIDNVINSGGVKLFPEQIEEKLAKRIPYRFFVASKEDEYLGNKLVLVIEAEKYDLPIDLFLELEKYEKPREIQFVNNFVETDSGKIIRKKNIQ
ncbi:AMP-binding protein [Myroides sp. M-43]|uniref:AMP-binding protein n=1 Tax=Myroides oncorhynchi TaxID=2893756 RepID=UPI001E3BEF33|nr:AMP-binding protein [Myroides oncorhynchi]MCC9041317.1 AMP-binding protein [Myroides oncorhynchi]